MNNFAPSDLPALQHPCCLTGIAREGGAFLFSQMKEIPLTRGLVAIVDDEDYLWLSRWDWYANKCGGQFYAYRRKSKSVDPCRSLVPMHRQIMDYPVEDLLVDHKNRNTLDNRRSNLRTCTTFQSSRNTGKSGVGKSCKYKGVNCRKENEKWEANIMVNRKNIRLGMFDNPIRAAIAYDNAAQSYFGEFACTNAQLFPEVAQSLEAGINYALNNPNPISEVKR